MAIIFKKEMEIITDNKQMQRYEMLTDGGTVFATYRRQDDLVQILHVEAPVILRGTGAAGRFMQELMEHLRKEKLKASPICSYAVLWLERHPEFKDVVKTA